MPAVTSRRAERQHRHRGSRCRRRIQYDADRHGEANKDVCHRHPWGCDCKRECRSRRNRFGRSARYGQFFAPFQRRDQADEQQQRSLLGLKPVTFHYKSDTQNRPQFGLIAEEVAEVDPDLVVRDEKGEIYTVRYDAVNAMVLNEFLKEHRKVEEQEHKLQEQDGSIQKQQATVEELREGICRLIETVKVEASEIQKVSARLQRIDLATTRVAADRQ